MIGPPVPHDQLASAASERREVWIDGENGAKLLGGLIPIFLKPRTRQSRKLPVWILVQEETEPFRVNTTRTRYDSRLVIDEAKDASEVGTTRRAVPQE